MAALYAEAALRAALRAQDAVVLLCLQLLEAAVRSAEHEPPFGAPLPVEHR